MKVQIKMVPISNLGKLERNITSRTTQRAVKQHMTNLENKVLRSQSARKSSVPKLV